VTERPWEPLPIETALNRAGVHPWRQQTRDTYIEGIDDWTGVPHEDDDRWGKLQFKVPERAQYTDKNYLEGIDWEHHEDRDAIARKHPIHPDDANVGQQFINRIEPIFSKLRRRPLSHGEYSVHLVGAPRTEYDENYQMKLAHKGVEVGNVSWSGDDGHVSGLDVEYGHRHMTTKLLQEAWDVSRKQGHFGPAAADDLTDYSGKIMKKFNPEASEYKWSNYARDEDPENYEGDDDDDDEDDEDDEDRWERLYDEAWENHRYATGEPCETCNGAGESRLYPQTQTQSTENGYVRRFIGPRNYVEGGSQTVSGYDSEGNDHEFEYNHPGYHVVLNHSPQKEGYTQDGIIRAQDESGTEVVRPMWRRPCPACSHLDNPGFPNHVDNR
jgi:hypothetical protein